MFHAGCVGNVVKEVKDKEELIINRKMEKLESALNRILSLLSGRSLFELGKNEHENHNWELCKDVIF